MVFIVQQCYHYTNLTFVCLSVRDGRSPEVDLTSSVSLLSHSFSGHIGKVGYDNCVVESAWTTTAYSCDVRFREHTGEG